MYELTNRLSRAYWPRPELNESANIEQGNKEVDKLSLGELVQFFSESAAGPTFCLVRGGRFIGYLSHKGRNSWCKSQAKRHIKDCKKMSHWQGYEFVLEEA